MKTIFIFAAGLVAATAGAHTVPARRQVAIQAERDALVVLATFSMPEHDASDALTALGDAALEAQLAARAVAPLSITLDGKPAAASVQTRLIEDPPRSGRKAAAVLLEIPIGAGAHEAVIALGSSGDATRMTVSADGAIASGRVPKGGVVPPMTSFTITWKEDR